MMAFEVKGQFRISVKDWQRFTIEVASENEAAAVEKTFALMGSRHNVKRQFVRIEDVKALKLEEVTDHRVKYLMEGGG
jgi:large subunit ribosomal protein LX